MNKKFEKLILTMFGVGYFSFFPGTIASLFTCIFFYFFWIFIGLKDYQLLIYITLVLIFIYSSYVINKHYNNKDAQEIVIDEFVGQSIPIMSFYYLNNLKILTIFSDLLSYTNSKAKLIATGNVIGESIEKGEFSADNVEYDMKNKTLNFSMFSNKQVEVKIKN